MVSFNRALHLRAHYRIRIGRQQIFQTLIERIRVLQAEEHENEILVPLSIKAQSTDFWWAVMLHWSKAVTEGIDLQDVRSGLRELE